MTELQKERISDLAVLSILREKDADFIQALARRCKESPDSQLTTPQDAYINVLYYRHRKQIGGKTAGWQPIKCKGCQREYVYQPYYSGRCLCPFCGV